MENEVFEKDYRDNMETEDVSNELNILDYAAKSGIFKAYDEAWRAIPRYVIQKNKEVYEDLLHRLDAIAKRRNGKIKGVVDYVNWDSKITVELPFWESCSPEDFTLLSEIATKTKSVTFEASEKGWIILSIRIEYFGRFEDADNLLNETLFDDEEFVQMLMEHREARIEKEIEMVLSDPYFSNILNALGERMGLSAEEVYRLVDENYTCDPEGFLSALLKKFTNDDDENKDAE